MNPIKVLIIESSAISRFILQSTVNADPALRVVAMATDLGRARQKIVESDPDVILLDLDSTAEESLVSVSSFIESTSKPVVVVADTSPRACANAISCLRFGAVDIIQKPGLLSLEHALETPDDISIIIKGAAEANRARGAFKTIHERLDNIVRPSKMAATQSLSQSFYAIGASTGGPELLRRIFTTVQTDIPGVVIALHLPALFTKSLAEQLNLVTNFEVREAVNGDHIRNNQVLIIPGDCHGIIKKDSVGYFLNLTRKKESNRLRPIDVLFISVAESAGSNATGIVLTGPGSDGASGLLAMKIKGSKTIAQSMSSSMVVGMPKHAIDLRAAQLVLSSDEIIRYIDETKEG